ncbi:hypothetical protein ASZ90_005702 [hydrocarbon metagenome]|uniref:DUF4911 domain-containing protein n=1 Tax=hydrocarbon metagenome TaxID=938273 RepID=A0A0W8FUQ3_9ZZZZ
MIFKLIDDNKKVKMVKKYYKLKRKDISIIQFIIEGYEGMATVTTTDPRAAIIQVSIIPDFLSEIKNVINDLKNKYQMEEINYPEKQQQV